MGNIIAGFTMSLDGFIADANDEVGRIMRWYRSGDTEVPVFDGAMVFKVSAASAAVLRERFSGTGAIVTGRRDFDVSNAWGGQSPLPAPIFIVTHHPPQEWTHAGSPFTFVTEGVERAVELARQAAGDKRIAIGSSTTTQQCLQAGLLDEIEIDLVPILLGSGVRLFEHLGGPIELEQTSVVVAKDVTHLRYNVVKSSKAS
ncbi:MAG TPA: dihydrofolate reductase family protein [Herpetosiphonaceae bacterium]